MRSLVSWTCVALLLGGVAAVRPAAAQSVDGYPPTEPAPADPPVFHYDLSGPRIGATFDPDGNDTRSQFGWHFEHSVSSSTRGPWFVVETVLLAGGAEQDAFIPNGSLIFGVRTPGSFEFGVGPSLTLGGSRGMHSAIVIAIGQSFRFGGIRVPVNLALSADRDGDERVSIVTGWAIRDRHP